MERKNAYINYRDVLPPSEWDFLSDDGRIVSGPTSEFGVRHCAFYVNGILTEFCWRYNSNIVILNGGGAYRIAERLNKEMCEDEILGGEYEAIAVSDATICFYEKNGQENILHED